MSKDQKIIKVKVGLLELAKQLGNVSQACKVEVPPVSWTPDPFRMPSVAAAAMQLPPLLESARRVHGLRQALRDSRTLRSRLRPRPRRSLPPRLSLRPHVA
jgi:hypothetical protein